MEPNRRDPDRFIAALKTPSARRSLAAFFESDRIEHQKLTRLSVGMLLQAPEILELIDLATRGATIDLGRLRVLDEPLVHNALRRTILTDFSLERLFTAVRRRLLELLRIDPVAATDQLPLMVSLACQCFNNEYVYATTAIEECFLDVLQAQISEASAAGNSAYFLSLIAAYAMYRPLYGLQCRHDLLDLGGELKEVIRRQIVEPIEEDHLKETVRSFGTVADPISRKVQQQYEEYPYPRWFNLDLGQQRKFAESLAARLPFLELPEISRPQILIAGCGTGRHPLQVAWQNPDSSVLAIDFSRASLAYAMRQTRRYKIPNIEFLHGDLLAIKTLNRTFDCIEAVGVLHHMADPQAGLKALVEVLRPGGFLRIGLYSKRGLAPLLEVQRICMAAVGTDRSRGSIRQARQAISEYASKLGYFEFFYLSGIPDLFCPAHAKHFSPADLSSLFADLGVEFLCFERIPKNLKKIYLERFPDDPFLQDLESIDRFEQDFPETFKSLNCFWLRKLPAGQQC